MKCAVFYGKHDLRVEERPVPVLGPKDVLVQVKACGVCGTDVHIYEGDKGAADTTPPVTKTYFTGMIKRLADGGILTEYDPQIMAAQFCLPISVWINVCDREPEREKEVMELVEKHIRQFFRLYQKA